MKKLFCFLFGHKYKLFMRINKNIDEIYCKRCGKEFAINHELKILLPLDKDLLNLHNEIILTS